MGHRKLERITGDERAFADEAPSAAQIDAAKVSVNGDHATVRLADGDSQRMIRQDGHWLVNPDDEAISPRSSR